MELRHIVAAADESDAGRHAVRVALDLAARSSAQVTVLRVLAVEATRRLVATAHGAESGREPDPAALLYLRRWLEADVLTTAEAERVRLATAAGIPGIEICRFAEQVNADLLVLGRKPHSQMARMLLGDTADAVARRSRISGLFVPPGLAGIRRILVALDGSERGMRVLSEASDFASALDAELRIITVERTPANEPLHLVTSLPLARSVTLEARVQTELARKALPAAELAIRRGDIVEQVVTEAQERGADALVVGYHRGGPPGVLEVGSTARRLVHAAPCAVLTIPL
jgi:nucleotide-binding universal stress UspA family protein